MLLAKKPPGAPHLNRCAQISRKVHDVMKNIPAVNQAGPSGMMFHENFVDSVLWALAKADFAVSLRNLCCVARFHRLLLNRRQQLRTDVGDVGLLFLRQRLLGHSEDSFPIYQDLIVGDVGLLFLRQSLLGHSEDSFPIYQDLIG